MSDLSENRVSRPVADTLQLIALHQICVRDVFGFGSEGAEFDRLVDLESAALDQLVMHTPEDVSAAVALCVYIASLKTTERLAANGDSLANVIVTLARTLRPFA